MAKKKTTVKNMVTPDPKNVKVGVEFDSLCIGEYFIMDGELWQKLSDDETCQAAFSIAGHWREDLCEEIIIPVEVTVAWKVK